MSAPTTPSKVDDAIERIKRSITLNWGLHFAPRDPVASPSKRNCGAIDERIHSFIRFLYYSKLSLGNTTPLDFALSQFNQKAPTVISAWRFKPRAENGVVPTRSQAESSLRHDFLHRPNELGDSLSKDLMLCLEHILSDVAQTVKTGQQLCRPESITVADSAMRSQIVGPRYRPHHGKGVHSTSDDFDEDDDLFMYTHPIPWTFAAENSATDSETFMTPPTTPSRRKRVDHKDGTNKNSLEEGEPSRPSKLKREESRGEAHPTQLRAQTSQIAVPRAGERPIASFISSFSSSMTSAFSAFTSPNTSFSTISQDDNIIDFDWESMSISDDMPAPAAVTSPGQFEGPLTFSEKLRSGSPLIAYEEVKQATVPFRQIYEVERAARATNIDIDALSEFLTKREDDYSTLWTSVCRLLRDKNLTPPEPSSSIAWDRAQEDFQGVSLTGRLQFFQSIQNNYFELQLMPLKVEPTYRLSRRFHGDRFCVLATPGLEPRDLPPYLKGDAEKFRTAFVEWLVGTTHEMLGRVWRAFFVKPDDTKRKQSGVAESKSKGFRVYLFAEDGQDFGVVDEGQKIVGETDWRPSRILNRPRRDVPELIEWFMPFEPNQEQHVMKFFARLSLGLSSTVKTREFKPNQIVRSDDSFANSPSERRLDEHRSDLKKKGRAVSCNVSAIMNDGCARISKHAASWIAMDLKLDYIPSAFQGRIGGAKGMWMVDSSEEILHLRHEETPFWIEVTDSQLKFEAASIDLFCPDPDRAIFEANSWSRPLSSTYLNYQLLPILHNRGVPREIFKSLLEQDLKSQTADLDNAIEDGLALRRWCQSNHPTTTDRLRKGCVEMLGGIPDSKSERINWFVDHGFEAKTCTALKNLVFELIRDHCTKLENRMNIGLESSTNAFMIADPLSILEADEVHIAFSGSFKDSQGFDLPMLHDINVSVARLPALLPSDIQKVRAVFKPELRIYRDVIVFSSRGDASLASKLSGGDYDGDKAWVCWEPSLVEPFQNASVPEQPSPDSHGIEKDLTKISDIIQYPDYIRRFLHHAFEFNLQPKMLGIITKYHEELCYARNSIDSPEAISIAHLLGLLVDSSKAGFKFSDSQWKQYREKHSLPASFPKPAYRVKDSSRLNKENLIDDLVFNTAKPVCESVLAAVYRKFPNARTFDDDLVRISRFETREAENDPSIAKVLESFRTTFEQIVEYWRTNCSRFKEDSDTNDSFAPQSATSKTRKPLSPGYRALVEKIRADFLAIPPCPNDAQSLAAVSPVVRRWAKEYYRSSSTTYSPSSPGAGPDYWSLLKASLAFSRYHSFSFIWQVAGVELGELKATAKGRGTYQTVVGRVFDALKVDGRLADAFVRKEEGLDLSQDLFGQHGVDFADEIDEEDEEEKE